MNDIDSNNNYNLDLSSPTSQEISPYDSNYPSTLLSNSIKLRLEQAQIMASEVYNVVAQEAPILTQVQNSLNKGYRYVVDVTENTLNSIDSGKIKLSTSKSGEVFAQVREVNGQYGSKLPIKKEYFFNGIDPVQMTNILQMKAIQTEIQSISNQIGVISQNIKEVLKGQQNDRIGLYYSGLTLYLESKNMIDSGMKKALVAESLRALSEATFQLTRNMQSDIEYLANKEYESKKSFRSNENALELIDSHMHSINQSFKYIHQSSMLRAGIYCNIGEFAAMSIVLEGYSKFIKETVLRNASMLAECDLSDDGTLNGVWKSRAKLNLDVSELTKQFNIPKKTVYIGILKEAESWEE